MFWFQIKGDFGKFYEHAASQAEPGHSDHGCNKVFLECWNTLLTMLRVLTGELSGLVEGGGLQRSRFSPTILQSQA